MLNKTRCEIHTRIKVRVLVACGLLLFVVAVSVSQIKKSQLLLQEVVGGLAAIVLNLDLSLDLWPEFRLTVVDSGLK